MAGTRRHGINAAIYMDTSAGGTAAVGTATLVLITSKGTWAFDQTRSLVNVTSFGDTSETNVAGLAGGNGDIAGVLDFADNTHWNAMSSSIERGLMIFPDISNNPGTYITGKAFFSPKYGGSVTGAVTQDITFTAGPTGLTWTHP